MQFYFDYSYSDPDPMLDLEAVEEEQRIAHDLHNGFICTVELV